MLFLSMEGMKEERVKEWNWVAITGTLWRVELLLVTGLLISGTLHQVAASAAHLNLVCVNNLKTGNWKVYNESLCLLLQLYCIGIGIFGCYIWITSIFASCIGRVFQEFKFFIMHLILLCDLWHCNNICIILKLLTITLQIIFTEFMYAFMQSLVQ